MSRCNYCMLRDIERVACRAGGTVELRAKPLLHPIAPEAVDVFIRYPSSEEPVWAAWLMSLPDHCCC